MDKFVAELTGEADGHKISREFGHLETAVDWLQGEALFPRSLTKLPEVK
jgi:hypothetical protein